MFTAQPIKAKVPLNGWRLKSTTNDGCTTVDDNGNSHTDTRVWLLFYRQWMSELFLGGRRGWVGPNRARNRNGKKHTCSCRILRLRARARVQFGHRRSCNYYDCFRVLEYGLYRARASQKRYIRFAFIKSVNLVDPRRSRRAVADERVSPTRPP